MGSPRGIAGPRRNLRGATILELLLGAAVLAMLLAMMLSVLAHASSIWQRASDSAEAFQSARLAFELMTRSIGQATLNTYLDYDDPSNPSRYLRKSELAFACGPAGTGSMPGTPGTGQAVFFQAPLSLTSKSDHESLDGLLNTCGFFVSYTTNSAIPQHVKAGSNPRRYRLMQTLVPAEDNSIYKSKTGDSWFSAFTNNAYPLADNIVALVLSPQDPASSPPDLTGNYTYSTRDNTVPQPDNAHQLPPAIKVTMVAIAETAANRLSSGDQEPAAISSSLTGKFSDPANYASDLAQLEKSLSGANITYRVFTSTVPIRESKWTK